MRRALGRLGARGAVGTGLALVVLGVVGLAKLADRGGPAGHYLPPARPPVTADPTEGDDAAVAPAPSRLTDEPVVLSTAAQFAAAWLRQDLSASAWHAGIAPFATQSLAQRLAGVDPAAVPASRILGEPQLALRAASYAQVVLAVDSGTLRLSLVRRDGRWWVDGVDWDRA